LICAYLLLEERHQHVLHRHLRALGCDLLPVPLHPLLHSLAPVGQCLAPIVRSNSSHNEALPPQSSEVNESKEFQRPLMQGPL
jgi:hypothetical protein